QVILTGNNLGESCKKQEESRNFFGKLFCKQARQFGKEEARLRQSVRPLPQQSPNRSQREPSQTMLQEWLNKFDLSLRL
ncbi:MAG: hypothetical protein AAB370_03475, partial [Verrucomicrobiota bacterium]